MIPIVVFLHFIQTRIIGSYTFSSPRVSGFAFSFLNLDADASLFLQSTNTAIGNFAKWSREQVYEWLNKNGFEAYFPASADGTFIHKWIKNGLHLLQATQHEYEKVSNLLWKL